LGGEGRAGQEAEPCGFQLGMGGVAGGRGALLRLKTEGTLWYMGNLCAPEQVKFSRRQPAAAHRAPPAEGVAEDPAGPQARGGWSVGGDFPLLID
jgi:hypothetical protein